MSIAFIFSKALFLLIIWRINTSVAKCITPFPLTEKSILVFELTVLSGPELIIVYVALQQ